MQMKKIILGLIVVFGLLGCKLPSSEKLDETSDNDYKSTRTTSDNLGLVINITHEKSIVYDSNKIRENPIQFSIELRNELDRGLEIIKSEGDSLRFYINETERSLVPFTCQLSLFGESVPVCGYKYSYTSNGVIEESLHLRVTLTRRGGEILTAQLDLPPPIKLLEPRIPFSPITPSSGLLSWQSETPMQLQLMGGVSSGGGTPTCVAVNETIVLEDKDTYFSLPPDYFPSMSGCGENASLIAVLGASKSWSKLESSSFKKLNIYWGDSYRIFLFGRL
jgi:hypothetical protein